MTPPQFPRATPNFTSPPPVATPVPDQASVPDAVMEITDARMEISNQGTVGPHLVDGEGMSLYLFTNDERNVSNCSGGCAEAWPPLLTLENTLAGDGLDAERVSSIEREDGSSQATYNGKPLYYFANDVNAENTLGQDRGDAWFLVSPDGAPIRTAASVVISETDALGNILTALSGNALYLYTKGEHSVSNCSGGCALAWPPLVTVDDPTTGAGLDETRIGTINRGYGVKQVTYNGWPLYYFAADEKPGDTNGQDWGDVWFGLSAYGGAVYSEAQVNTVVNEDLGTILTDATGRSLYFYTKGERNVANCAGGRAQAWPPVITIEDPVPGEGGNGHRIGVTTREDGSSQVTYNGWPLYYFAADEKPGDTNGQDRGDVWFVLNTDSSAVYTNAPVNSTSSLTLDSRLTDAAGRTLYLYTKDARNISNCTAGCALARPPLITVGDPVPGEGLDADRRNAPTVPARSPITAGLCTTSLPMKSTEIPMAKTVVAYGLKSLPMAVPSTPTLRLTRRSTQI